MIDAQLFAGQPRSAVLACVTVASEEIPARKHHARPQGVLTRAQQNDLGNSDSQGYCTYVRFSGSDVQVRPRLEVVALIALGKNRVGNALEQERQGLPYGADPNGDPVAIQH